MIPVNATNARRDAYRIVFGHANTSKPHMMGLPVEEQGRTPPKFDSGIAFMRAGGTLADALDIAQFKLERAAFVVGRFNRLRPRGVKKFRWHGLAEPVEVPGIHLDLETDPLTTDDQKNGWSGVAIAATSSVAPVETPLLSDAAPEDVAPKARVPRKPRAKAAAAPATEEPAPKAKAPRKPRAKPAAPEAHYDQSMIS